MITRKEQNSAWFARHPTWGLCRLRLDWEGEIMETVSLALLVDEVVFVASDWQKSAKIILRKKKNEIDSPRI